MKPSLTLVVLCVAAVARLPRAETFGAPPATTPATQPDTQPALYSTDAQGRIVWYFTSYLKGTNEQMTATLNGEVERLLQLRAGVNAEIVDQLKEIAPRQKQVTQRIRQSKQYLNVQEELKAAEQHKRETQGDERMAVTATIGQLRATLMKLEHDGIWADPRLKEDLTQIRAKQEQLRVHGEALAKAQAWRVRLVELIHNSLAFPYPPEVGSTGGVYTITPITLAGPDTVVTLIPIYEWGAEGHAHEEIREADAERHSLRFVLRGINGAAIGKPIEVNAVFRVEKWTGPQNDPDRAVYYASRVKDDTDVLIAATKSLPDPVKAAPITLP